MIICTLPIAGCAFYSDRALITVAIPELPPHLIPYIGSAAWRIAAPLSVESEVASEELGRARAVELLVPKAPLVPIVASSVAVSSSPNRVTCGGFFPVDLDASGSIALHWEDGMLASLLLDYVETGGDPCWIDIETIRGAIDRNSSDNPWEIDRDVLSEAVSHQALTASAVRKERHKRINLPLPEGIWYEANPLRLQPLRARTGWEGVAYDVGEGTYLFFSYDEERIAELFAGNDEWGLVINRDPESGVFGKW